MSTPSHNANNSAETHTDKRQTRDPNQRETDIASQPHLSKIAGIGASLARFALNKPITIGMLFLSMLLFGIVSGRLLPLEKFPGIDIPEMVVQIPYPDATPVEIETMITRPVEEAVATMSGIKRLRARSTTIWPRSLWSSTGMKTLKPKVLKHGRRLTLFAMNSLTI